MVLIQVNEWLDEYNDYMLLYKMFGDQIYSDEAKEILESMKKYVVLVLEHLKLTASC
ncbi:hypothetical protein LJR153_001051 [Paenibacillus sp. LjRoot153]|uniref:hypothetical protein n=1 Tax=Paenibacillus sp. LjRoot153 TaxID=3342270 RepID=UPI003ECC3420